MSHESSRRGFVKSALATAAVVLPPAALAHAAVPGSASKSKPGQVSSPLYNVVSYGAVGDGKTVCTTAIQKAVDACAAAGGGKVVFPAGKYLTGAIFLKSNIEVEVLAGARLLFTTDFDSVPSIPGRWEGVDIDVYASLFTGTDLENVSITGHGILDGQGEAWWKAHGLTSQVRKKAGVGGVREAPNPPGSPLKWGRPRMINLYRCKNVTISGLTVLNSPSWNIHPVLCENVCIDGVTIYAPDNSPNTDGIDPDSCKNVRIANCDISVGDDCIIIKSGYAYQENGTPCENVTVTNCVFGAGHAGVGIGSETSGGVKNVTISNCICDGTDRGLRFKTARGRGNVVENIRASNFVMRNVGEAVTVTMFYTGGDMHAPQPVSKKTPIFRNFHFSEIVVTGVKRPVVIEGLPEMPIQGVSINNLVVDGAQIGAACTNAVGVVLDTVVINAEKGPALNADAVKELEVYRFTTKKPKPGTPVVRLQNVNNAVIQSCTAAEGTDTFLEVNGAGNKDITLFANRLSRATRDIALVAGATEGAVTKGA